MKPRDEKKGRGDERQRGDSNDQRDMSPYLTQANPKYVLDTYPTYISLRIYNMKVMIMILGFDG